MRTTTRSWPAMVPCHSPAMLAWAVAATAETAVKRTARAMVVVDQRGQSIRRAATGQRGSARLPETSLLYVPDPLKPAGVRANLTVAESMDHSRRNSSESDRRRQ
jgi:hypothetical protein